MTNPNRPIHNNPHHETDTPFALNERGRRVVAFGGAAIAAGALVAGISGYNALAGNRESVDETSSPTINELVLKAVHDGPDAGDVITSTLQQGDATSLVLEKSASELEQIDNLGFLKGQQGATLVSAKEIDSMIQQLTGGAPQPGDKVHTWRDDETGYIVSSVDASELVAPPQN